jgi:hypothetical protein
MVLYRDPHHLGDLAVEEENDGVQIGYMNFQNVRF